ncbi:efflux RND transporter periplasmic adaptor subunit [Pedobacter gandavensis]|uniref:Efflux RND transporter periplasmic adaptor subunit n=1 Tax=Pedobacter gandavensis TaxID=2679963 RepID=A0ABR6ERF3_9SPHI|nr:efflux RND transporter periplasmic adaptor subunit [Pedobacter gandavensis]MBB2147627.1 efflux RND transporter periplasmic adaptor subunit [Pedobacter gandavensis]
MNRVSLMTGLMCCFGLFSCNRKAQPDVPPVPVNLYQVDKHQVVYYDNYPGTMQALNQVNLLPVVQGLITGIFFKDGSQVKKGQVLYEIDKRVYQSTYDQQAANLKVSQDNLTQAQQDADRYTYLNNYKAVAKQQYDHAMIALQVAKSQVKAANQVLKAAKDNLNYAVIRAPYSGSIGISQVKLGNMVNVGQTILNTISTNDPMAVDFQLNEKQLPDFERLLNAKASARPDSLFTLLLPNNELYDQQGSISFIDRAVDPQTGSILVRLIFPNPKQTLKSGMSSLIRVHNLDTQPQMLIPSRAVTEQMGEYFVFIAQPDTSSRKKPGSEAKSNRAKPIHHGSNLMAVQKKIKTGATIGANVIVVSGINPGDKIVVDGIQSLHDGTPIAPGKYHQMKTNR